MQVHNHFGLGFPEIIYHRSLIINLEEAGLQYGSEVERSIYYKDRLVGKRRLDLIVEGRILIELKAVTELDSSCYNKVLNYLKVYDIEVGLLLNFGTEKLQYKRFVN